MNIGNEVTKEMIAGIIKNGDLVWVKLDLHIDWYSDAIHKIDLENNTVEIFLTGELTAENIKDGDHILCRIIEKDAEYILECNVKEILTEKIILTINQIKKYDEIRESSRYIVNLSGTVISDNNDESAFVTVKNISKSGAAFSANKEVPINENVELEIVLWGREVVNIQGKIVRMIKSGDIYKYGLKIINIDEKSKEIWIEYFEELERLHEEMESRL